MHKDIGDCGHIHQYDMRDLKGRVFFTTDLHGHYDLLHEKFREVGFDSTKDLLISGGDWCDRGPDSKHVLDYLTEPFIASVAGNHEELFISSVDENWQGRNTNCLLSNGGMWVANLSDSETTAIYETFKSLPLGIEIIFPSGIKVGVVHAECPYNDWDKFVGTTKAELEWNDKATAQWSGSWYTKKHQGNVKGVDLVLVGHTPTDTGEPELLGNMLFCDAGSFFRDKITFIEITEEFVRSKLNEG